MGSNHYDCAGAAHFFVFNSNGTMTSEHDKTKLKTKQKIERGGGG